MITNSRLEQKAFKEIDRIINDFELNDEYIKNTFNSKCLTACKAAIKNNPEIINKFDLDQFKLEEVYDLYTLALNYDPNIFELLNRSYITYHHILQVIEFYPQEVINLPHELLINAVSLNPMCLEYIGPELQTLEIVVAAANKDSSNQDFSCLEFANKNILVEIYNSELRKMAINDYKDQLFSALSEGNLDSFLKLVDNSLFDPNYIFSKGNSILHAAILSGDQDFALHVLNYSVSNIINLQNIELDTPLMLAVKLNMPLVVNSLIINFGADVDVLNKDGQSILVAAILSKSDASGVINFLRMFSGINSDLVKLIDDYKYSILMHACELKDTSATDKIAIVNYLIEIGADVNYMDDVDNSALSIAVDSGCSELVSTLIKNGANLPNQDDTYSVFDHAEKKSSEIFTILLNAKKQSTDNVIKFPF